MSELQLRLGCLTYAYDSPDHVWLRTTIIWYKNYILLRVSDLRLRFTWPCLTYAYGSGNHVWITPTILIEMLIFWFSSFIVKAEQGSRSERKAASLTRIRAKIATVFVKFFFTKINTLTSWINVHTWRRVHGGTFSKFELHIVHGGNDS